MHVEDKGVLEDKTLRRYFCISDKNKPPAMQVVPSEL